MKKKLIFISVIIFLAGLVIAATDSPYARRIRPVTSLGTCIENEVAYNMTDHSFNICTNTGYIPVLTGSGSFANTALSNLASVAINTNLLPGTNGTLTLGDSTHGWNSIILNSDGSGLHRTTLVSTATTPKTLNFPNENGTICSTGSICSGYQASGSYALTTGDLSQFASTTSALLRGVISDENGTGVALFDSSTSATFITPNLGIPTTLTLTNATGLPISTGISGLGTGVATFLATPTTANFAAAITGETGTGNIVFSASPTFTGTVALPTGITVNANTITFPTTTATLARTDSAQTFTGAQTFSSSPLMSTLTSGRVTFATTSGGLVDDADLTFSVDTLTVTKLGATTLTGTIAGGGNQLNNIIIGTTTPLAGAFTTLTASGAITQTSASATAFSSGPNGATNPVFQLINSTASQADGISITGLAAGNGITINNISSGSNSGTNWTLKGTGAFTLTGAASTYVQVWSQAGTDIGGFSTNAGLTVVNGRNTNWYDGGSLASPGTLRQQIKGGVAGGLYLDSTSLVGFFSAGVTGSPDTTISRNSVGVSQFGTTAANSSGWFNYAGSNQCFLQADQTNATTTFANINNCIVNVTSGRRYTFKAIFYLSDSISADGAKINFNGGAATSTNFRVHCTAFDSALNLSSQGTALATAYSASTFTGAGMFECHGTFEPSSTSTFIPQFAQNAHTTGTLTLARGSNILVQDVGP